MYTSVHVAYAAPYTIRASGATTDPNVEAIFEEHIPEALPALRKFSRGMYSNELHYKSFNKFNLLTTDVAQYTKALASSPAIQAAITRVESELRPFFSVEAIPLNELDRVPYVSSSAAGYGYVGSKKTNYALARSRATGLLFEFIEHRDTFRHTPFKAFARTQLAPVIEPKVRHVWGAPFHNILLEGTIASPILESLSRNTTPVFIGRNVYKDLPSQLVLPMSAPESIAYCIDFSSFDTCVLPYFTKKFFNFIRSCVHSTDERFPALVDYIEDYMIHTPVLMPNGDLHLVNTGLPSGSYFTQLLGSYVNLVLQYAFQLTSFGKTVPTSVLGDDAIFVSITGPAVPTAAIADFFIQFGFKVNVSKTIVTHLLNDVLYLGHNFKASRLTRSEFIIAQLLLFVEREVPSPEHSYTRVLSLLLDSGYNSNLAFNVANLLQSRYNFEGPSSFGPPPYYPGIFRLS